MAISPVASTPIPNSFLNPNRAVVNHTRAEGVEGTQPDQDGDKDDAVRAAGAQQGGSGSLGRLLDVAA